MLPKPAPRSFMPPALFSSFFRVLHAPRCFQVESVYLPASEVGGDFFFVSSAPDGSLIAIVGDVSGKGLTAAMRVAMILGALRRKTSHDPGEILFGLNNALVAQGQLGFTTACCIRISLSGEYTLSNAGHIAPYLSGRELETASALPLGLIQDQTYDLTRGHLPSGERLVLAIGRRSASTLSRGRALRFRPSFKPHSNDCPRHS